MQSEIIDSFQDTLYRHYDQHGRVQLPWRQPTADGSFDPYFVMVSELMLQQTQVARVIPKYQSFLAKFPTVQVLANAPLAAVLNAWSGLGYNRRAKYLHQSAKIIATELAGVLPNTNEALVKLPGIGSNTAGAMLAYAFNEPVVFIETNIRTVFIHHFFPDQQDVSDQSILELVEQLLDRENPRLWYWALMDYGSYLKQTVGNLSRLSSSYAKQSKFQGSRRQLRGALIRLLSSSGPLELSEISQQLSDDRLAQVLTELVQEGLVRQEASHYDL